MSNLKNIYFATSPALIGRHEWRMIVTDSWLGRTANYEWRIPRDTDCQADNPWQHQADWPTYNENDGEWGGMPKGLRNRIWSPNMSAIYAALGQPPRLNTQIEMF